ncbi:hypothetical protein GO730_28280 [Spirosoma sp. HMF3257]|uniref:Uncharacterized protein n=2 Tax=Spirosoma telluris TaxID=2183553 RepID=A0A327NTH6_9BACT|nr:hypothetical protein [Spirosoma telluris]RAI78637.1 hypothetical protein HMF3257_28225 [Spirosoma telluris]
MLKDDEKAQREDLKNKLKDAKNTSEAKQKALQDLNQHQAKPNNGQNFQNPDVLEQILSQKQPGSVAPSQNKSTDIDALLQDIFPQNKNLNSTKNACPIRAPGKQNLINNPPATPPAKSKSNFDKYQPEILKHEGGFVDDPDDPGGATNKGITFATFKAHAKKDLGIEPTLENLKALTDEQAGIIYKKNYWDTVKGDQIKSSSLGYALYDFNVNAGKNSVKVMQKTLNEMGANLTVDGGMGDKTVEAINKADPEVLFEKYQANRKQYYKDIIAKNPKLQKFEKGWMKRVDSMEFDDPVEEQPQLPNNFPPILP